MNKFARWNILWIAVFFFITTGCRQNSGKSDASPVSMPLPSVRVTYPVRENKTMYTTFQAVSRYMQSVNFRAGTAGVVTAVFVRPGDEIKRHQPLFLIKPMEMSALESAGALSKSLLNSHDTIFSGQLAFANQVVAQEGDYVQPGSLLASAWIENSLAAVTYVPFSLVPLIKKNSPCTVEIPGKKNVPSFFRKQLFLADNITQTQPYVVPLPGKLKLAGNMNLLVKFRLKEIKNGLFLPKSAILTNEKETAFWIMKMANDTTAVKVPVTIGWQGKKQVQIISNQIGLTDKIITEGAYGLPDTAYVKIAK
jgi:multidrug efflux pump subunit AcrA (membrane-fusion protein)